MSTLEQFRDPELDVSGDRIGFYPREFYVCDNFSAFQVEYCDVIWPTSEHLYQAAHFFATNPYLVEQILQARSPHEAQKIANANKQFDPENWDEIKVEVMYEICKLKLSQHKYIRSKLLQTGELEIVEDSPKDAYWGWGPNCDGRNELGKIWMRLRNELRAGEIQIQ
jgi:ribA/ribD-fused uncharacterized protein